jgi:hypothetical protein
LRIFFLPPHKSAAFAGSLHLTQTVGNESRPFQGFACGKTLGAASRGGEGKKNYSESSLRTAINASVAPALYPDCASSFFPLSASPAASFYG